MLSSISFLCRIINHIFWILHHAVAKISLVSTLRQRPFSLSSLGPTVSAGRGISSRAAEFGFFSALRRIPRILSAEFVFFTRHAAEFDVFHSNNYFFTENYLKVALLQV